MTGEYSPADPLLFRHSKKQQETKKNNKVSFKSITNGRDNAATHGNLKDPITNDSKHKSSRHDSDPTYQELLERPHETQSNSPESQNRLYSKFGEIKKLGTPYFSFEDLD